MHEFASSGQYRLCRQVASRTDATTRRASGHAPHEPPDRLEQKREDDRGSDGCSGDCAEELGEREAVEKASNPSSELVPERDRQEPDSHHETDDPRRREFGNHAETDRTETELAPGGGKENST